MVKDLGNALGTLQENLELLEQTMENLAETVAELEEFLLIVDNSMLSRCTHVTHMTTCIICTYVADLSSVAFVLDAHNIAMFS